MSHAPGAVLEPPRRPAEPLINDVVIEVATTNGSGSQSANQVLTRAIFQMGIPVGAKSLFPSNIQGLPTWYTIRANAQGYTARRRDADVMVCMNGESADEDLAGLKPGAVVLIREDLTAHVTREDLRVVQVPFTRLVGEVCENPRLRKMVINILYVGVLAHLLGIEMGEVERALEKTFGAKPKALKINRDAARAAYDWAAEHLAPLGHLRLERMQTPGHERKVLIEGNRATALGALWGGVTVVPWYPITPSSSVAEYLSEALAELRHDPATGRATYAILQAEDELAAISMVLGAGWTGARAMTATSGPGISLMAEQAGLAYFAEIPAVIVDVQRMGPSTGLPTRTSQGDILKAYTLSHGDCRHLLLIPGTIQECFDFATESFNFAERFQTLVFLMSDLDLGMNLWMADPLAPPTRPIDRGKVLTPAQLDALGGRFERYGDPEGEGIGPRTLPGTEHPGAAYFTRGTGHTPAATYTERSADWIANIDRLEAKFETARRELPAPVLTPAAGPEPARVGILAYGSTDAAMAEALAELAGHGLAADYLRIRALPPHGEVRAFIERLERVYVVEQNRDAQMRAVLAMQWPELAGRLRAVTHYGGLAIDARAIHEPIIEAETRERQRAALTEGGQG